MNEDTKENIVLCGIFVFSIVLVLLWIILSAVLQNEELMTHRIIIFNSGESDIEYELYLDITLVSSGTIASNSEASINLTTDGHDTTLTLIADGQSYERIYGGGGWGKNPLMPEKVYFVVKP